MKPCQARSHAARALFAAVVLIAVALPAYAARVGVLSNKLSTETAADFANRIPAHTFRGVDTSISVPSVKTLLENYDVLLVFEDVTYVNAPSVGKAAAAFANSGRVVVLGTFYEQERSDALSTNNPNGWGPLEQIDPNITDGRGTPYAPRALDTASLVPHVLTRGLKSLTSAKWAGGNQAKPGTTVVATWKEPNARGLPDPAIAYRITDQACVIHVAIAPSYPLLASGDFSGDFHRAWANAFDFASQRCVGASVDASGQEALAIPTLSNLGLLLTALLVAGVGWTQRRRFTRR